MECKWKSWGKCLYAGGEYDRTELVVNVWGDCCNQNDCIACEHEGKPKLTPTKEPMMMSFSIGGNDDMLDLISILNEVMYRFDHVEETELKAVVSWFKTRYGGE